MVDTSPSHHEPDKKRIYVRRIATILSALAVLLLLLGVVGLIPYRVGWLLLVAVLPFAAMSIEKLGGYTFTAWVLACAGLAMLYPGTFITWGDFRLELLIIPLTQIIMFGMGTTLSIHDFLRVTQSPWPVFVGIALQFGVMPIVGFSLALSFGFDGELAAGIILIGSCSGGVASNLMVYLARGNVALSVTMTFASTLCAPLATPFLMSALAGTFVPIDTLQMMFSILNMIIVPVIAGLFAHEILYSNKEWAKRSLLLSLLSVGSIGFSLAAFVLGSEVLGPLYSGFMMGGVLIASITITKLVINVLLGLPNTWMDTVLPFVAKAAICMVIIIIIAQTYNVLIAVGVSLLLAAILHNSIGYGLGYWGSRTAGTVLGIVGYKLGLVDSPKPIISETECRTIAFEVGMQNGGMASGLAVDVLQSQVAALPPNIFGTWMNISGSMLANYWVQRAAGDYDFELETEQATAAS